MTESTYITRLLTQEALESTFMNGTVKDLLRAADGVIKHQKEDGPFRHSKFTFTVDGHKVTFVSDGNVHFPSAENTPKGIALCQAKATRISEERMKQWRALEKKRGVHYFAKEKYVGKSAMWLEPKHWAQKRIDRRLTA